MSYWPRLKLTEEEARYCQKYYDPMERGRGVLRRAYPGSMELTETQRRPIFPFQISRRCRVFGLTVAGDVQRFRWNIIDVTGEQHTAQETYLLHLFSGFASSPQSAAYADPTITIFYPNPYIFEPNIVLAPNQTLTIEGSETEPFVATDYRVDFVLHVWEFPGMPGSPL